MGERRGLLRAVALLLVGIGGGVAAAQDAPVGGVGAARSAAPAADFATPAPVTLSTRVYVWTFLVPVLTTERVEVLTRVLSPTVRSRRWNYELPTLRSKHYKLGQVAEFSCKYMDWTLPEDCRTVWHNVYADLPVLAMQRDHVDYDALEWAWEEQRLHITVPRWSWREKTFTLGVPAFSVEDAGRARARLDAEQAALTDAIDEGTDALDTSIAVVKAQGADPRSLSTRDGESIDLPALHRALDSGKADALDRMARIRGELEDALAHGADGPR